MHQIKTDFLSGTMMMSGCGILTNGKGTRREYGDFNLDELQVDKSFQNTGTITDQRIKIKI